MGDQQGLLPFPASPNPAEAADFIPDESNRQALTWLEAGWPTTGLVLWGPQGCGKTHLLRMWARRTGARFFGAGQLRDLDDLPGSGGLVLDDADRFGDEVLLFHVFNTARDRGLPLLMAARLPPSRWPVALPDLSSRLRTCTAVEIGVPTDALLRMLLDRFLSDRQVRVAAPVREWLLRHLPREAGAVERAVDQLNAASLREGKPITRAFAAATLRFPF